MTPLTPFTLFQAARFRIVAVCLGLLVAQALNQLFLWGRATADRQMELQAARMQRDLAEVPDILRLQSTYKDLDWTMAVSALKGDRDWRKDAETALERADQRLKQQLASLQGLEPGAVSAIQEEMNRASRHSIEAVSLMVANNIRDAELSAKIYRNSLQKTDTILSELLSRQQLAMEEFQRRMAERSSDTLLLYISSGLLSLVLIAALVYLVFRSFVVPLGRSVAAIRQINAGAAKVELPPPSTDEFGEMTGVLRQFVEQTERLRALAYTDELTGLASRARLMERLEKSQPKWSDQATGLFYLDVDRFRAVNESLGHSRGDELLREVARRLRAVVPQDALISRFSGDEFVFMVEGLPDDDTLPPRLRDIAERVLLSIAAPLQLGDQAIAMSGSIGIAVAPRDGLTPDELISSASAAVNLAKNSGRNNAQFASSKLTDEARRQITLLSDIRRGIDGNEFEPFYQPIVNVTTGSTVGAEALLRWRHPERGVVFPGDFIRTAEDSGLIADVGRACLAKACAYSQALRERGKRLSVSVNLSARQLDDEKIVSVIDDLCSNHGVSPGDISFEITESAVMQHPDRNLRILSEIRDLGHRLSVDDFGTGYSSLSYLERFPVDRIKIDRSFVLKVGESKATRAIVSATLTLAEKLGMDVVAEGVDAPEQMRKLVDLGCELQQGFLYARALPTAEMDAWLARHVAPFRNRGRAA